jgi:hypothetical protein
MIRRRAQPGRRAALGRWLALGGIVVAGAAAAFGVVILRDKDRARPPRLRADFETGDLSQWEGRFTPASLGTGTADITVVQSPVKGNYAARITTTTAEETGNQATSSRAELYRTSLRAGNKGFPVAEGKELWARWSIYVPNSTATSNIPTGGDGMVIQQQSSNITGGPIELNGLLHLRSNMTLNYSDGDSTNTPRHGQFLPASAPLAPDRWHEIMIHKKYSTSITGGFVEIYINGVQQQLCVNADCSVKSGRIVQRTMKAGVDQYRQSVGMYYQDRWDPTGQMRPLYFLDDFKIFDQNPRE